MRIQQLNNNIVIILNHIILQDAITILCVFLTLLKFIFYSLRYSTTPTRNCVLFSIGLLLLHLKDFL